MEKRNYKCNKVMMKINWNNLKEGQDETEERQGWREEEREG